MAQRERKKNERKNNKNNEEDARTLNKGGLEVRRPDDFALAFDGLPAFPAGDDGLDGVLGVRGRAGGGDGVGDVVHGGDTDMVRDGGALYEGRIRTCACGHD